MKALILKFLHAGLTAALLLTAACGGSDNDQSGDWKVATMPEALSNNAVATLEVGESPFLYSFSGLGPGKTRLDIASSAWSYDLTTHEWVQLPDVPGDEQGGRDRLASVAVGLYDRVFVIGGYTVAEDGTEVSTPEVFSYDPVGQTYKPRAPMPVPVDDAVAFAYSNRYIYLVSGWHDDGNVADVQVLDTWEDRWFVATPYPGAPLFGHAGGIVGNRFVIADGVKITGVTDGQRQFGISDEAWMGEIDLEDPATITWTRIDPHPGQPLYRMAATGSERTGLVVFAGGSGNPYNFDGIGYDGAPSEPSGAVFAYNPTEGRWITIGKLPVATMDHRGLLEVGSFFYTIGGMLASQRVTGDVHAFRLRED